MAQITRLSRLVTGINRGVDLTTNTLVVQDIMVGGTSGSTLTKAILDAVGGTAGVVDASAYHTHDGRYFTQTQLGSTTVGASGAKDIGVSGTPTNYTAATPDVQAHLAGIDTKLGTVSSSAITALTGDVTASGPGSAAATVAKIQGTTVAGTTGTGNVVFSASPTLTGTIAGASQTLSGTLVATGAISGSNLTAGGHAALDLALTGGTMSGNIAMGGNKVTGLGAPTANGDALRFDQLGAVSGIATLDGSGHIPVSQMPTTALEYQGAWNPATNTPALSDATGTNAFVYRVSTAFASTVSGLADASMSGFQVGDLVIFSSAAAKWQRAPTADGVVSVNGSQGAVIVNAINQLTGDVTTAAASQSQSEAATIAKIQGTTVAGTTGTGNVMFSASPTTTGTLTAATITASGPVTGSNLSGTNTGDQTITLTGDVTGSGTGSFAATIGANKVDETKIRLTNTGILRARNAAGTADVSILHVDASNVTQFDQLPQANFSPAANTDLTNKTYVDNLGTVKRAVVVGDATLAANTTYAVRWGKVSLGETADRVYKADQDATTNDNFHVIGFIQSGGAGQSAGDNVTLTMLGAITLAASDPTLTSAMTGLPVYLNAAGAWSTTAPSVALSANVIVAMVETTTKLYVQQRHISGVN